MKDFLPESVHNWGNFDDKKDTADSKKSFVLLYQFTLNPY